MMKKSIRKTINTEAKNKENHEACEVQSKIKINNVNNRFYKQHFRSNARKKCERVSYTENRSEHCEKLIPFGDLLAFITFVTTQFA